MKKHANVKTTIEKNDDKVNKKLSILKNISAELYETELSYNKNLADLLKILSTAKQNPYMINLSKDEYKKIVEQTRNLIKNSDQLLPLLSDLKKAHAAGKDASQKIEHVLTPAELKLLSAIEENLKSSAPDFANYTTLCTKVMGKIQKINYDANEQPEFYKFLAKANKNYGGQVDPIYFSSTIIAGIQRFPRYEIQFSDYVKHALDDRKDKEYPELADFKAAKDYEHKLKNFTTSLSAIGKIINNPPKVAPSDHEKIEEIFNAKYKQELALPIKAKVLDIIYAAMQENKNLNRGDSLDKEINVYVKHMIKALNAHAKRAEYSKIEGQFKSSQVKKSIAKDLQEIHKQESLKQQSSVQQFKSQATSTAKKVGTGYVVANTALITAPALAHKKGLLGRLKTAASRLASAKKTSHGEQKILVKPREETKKSSKLKTIKRMLSTKKNNTRPKPQSTQ